MPKTSINIWFNRTFATTYWAIQMLRDNPDGAAVTIFATHVDPASPVLQAADYRGVESVATGEEYILWALDYCEANNIDVFIPRNNIDIIAQNISRFETIGVKVLSSNVSDIRLLEDKGLTYAKATEAGIAVPPYHIASTAEAISDAYTQLRHGLDATDRIVVKPTVGVGATGFHVIDNEPYSLARFNDPHPENTQSVGIKDVIGAYELAEQRGEPTPELLLLPWLDAPEVSIDCLSDRNGKLVRAIPRIKDGDRITVFSNRYPTAVETVERWYENFDLRYLTNTQLRWWRGELVLLETNTRAAGGLFATTITGVNMMWEAVSIALGGETTAAQPKLDQSYVSLPTVVPVLE